MDFHEPVLQEGMCEYMALSDSGIYCDCTVGGGGHLLAMLQRTRKAEFIGLDCDPEAIAYARQALCSYRKRVRLFQENFINLDLILEKLNVSCIDGALMDLGVSYHQLTTAERGFSFEREGKLFMNMSPSYPTLAVMLKNTTKDELARILKEFGNVRNYKRTARFIFEQRKTINTTIELRNIIAQVIPKRFLKKNLHKIFQALRIWVNDELNNLQKGLIVVFRKLCSNGRIVVISYHSGEDRIVKQQFRDWKNHRRMKLLHKKIIRPSQEEIDENPRARSARMRVGQKCVV